MSNTESGAKVLVVDDHVEMARGLAEYLEDYGYSAEVADSGRAAINRVLSTAFDAVITDLRMKDCDGMAVLRAVRKADPTVPVLLMTAFGSVDVAIDAIKQGAYHYFSKPLKAEEVVVFLGRAVEQHRFELERGQLLRNAQDRYSSGKIVARSAAIRRVLDVVERIADTNATALITGESGTGKELIARAIHFRGARASRPFVPINCAAIPATLLEAELFGHEKGAFTGAATARAGLAAEAAEGTLFLDEVGDLPLELQPKLLRLLQDGEVRPLGCNSVRRVRVRIVAATNQDIAEKVTSGTFRQDLFYRLSVVPILVPPLRERPDDIPVLAERFLRRTRASNAAVTAERLSQQAVRRLLQYRWPGNVRELENAIERAAILCSGTVIDADDLAFLASGALSAGHDSPSATSDDVLSDLPTLKELERRYIDRVLGVVGGSKIKAAAVLGVDPSTLYRREKKAP